MDAQTAIKTAFEKLVGTTEMFTNYDVTKFARSFTDDNVRHNEVILYINQAWDDYHNRVAGAIDLADYVIDVVSVPNFSTGGSNQAVLYRPSWEDKYNYDPDAIQTDKSLKASTCCGGGACNGGVTTAQSKAQKAAAAAAAIVKKFQQGAQAVVQHAQQAAPVSPSTASGNSQTRVVTIDNRGRVCIPKEYLERIGVKAGDMAHVHVSSVKNKLVIANIKWSPASHTHLGQYQADCYGNVRIPERVMKQATVTRKPFGSNAQSVTVRSESDHIVIE